MSSMRAVSFDKYQIILSVLFSSEVQLEINLTPLSIRLLVIIVKFYFYLFLAGSVH